MTVFYQINDHQTGNYMFRLSLIALFFITAWAEASAQDSVKTYYYKPITVTGVKFSQGKTQLPVEKANLSAVLDSGGFTLIRKGSFLAQDVYADGLKRGDYTVIIDGERYHNACPMRMDAPLSRINPVDIETLEMDKSSTSLQSGLGGAILVHRSIPKETWAFNGSFSQVAGAATETDFSVSGEGKNHRLNIRAATGLPFETGGGKTFRDLYGYKQNFQYRFAESGVYGVTGDWSYGTSVMYSEEVSFPYLQMDERYSTVYNGSVGFHGHKIYLNYTDHLMNNELRTSYLTMPMETKATNLTVGITGSFYEVYYRRWDADNKLIANMGKMVIQNHLLPEVGLYGGTVAHELDFAGLHFAGKAGVAGYQLGDSRNLDFYKKAWADSKDTRFYPVAGLSVTGTRLIADQVSVSGMLDFAAEIPEAEALYVKVQRMTGKPWWTGNPELDQPFRSTVRTNLHWSFLSADLFGSYILGYVSPASVVSGTQKYQTFDNINALLAGITVKAAGPFTETRLVYTYGENRSSGKPLTEIQPLQWMTTVKSPEWNSLQGWMRHTWENAQKRVDSSLLETESKSWNKVDAGISGTLFSFRVDLEAENLLNETFTKHLSYVRDPFSSGTRVVEPGRSFRLNLRYSY